MKTLVLFYSFSGKTKAIASAKAQELDADLFEVRESSKRNAFQAFTAGCYQSIRQKMPSIQPLHVDVDAYERIIILMPIWAGSPAPAFNSLVGMMPTGKPLELIFTSGSGNSNRKKVTAYVQTKGFEVVSYLDIKS